jgi:hypothetical protein
MFISLSFLIQFYGRRTKNMRLKSVNMHKLYGLLQNEMNINWTRFNIL